MSIYKIKNANKELKGYKLDGNEELKILVTLQRIDRSFYLVDQTGQSQANQLTLQNITVNQIYR